MISSVARAHQLLQSLADCGLEHALICPGSRNAPFIYASEKVDITFHSRIDERTAAFTALGIAQETKKPVALITTSGTAISHAYPAILEAEASHIPLLLISADRPSYLKNSGASQTLNQSNLFGEHVKFFLDVHENYPLQALAQETARCYAAAEHGAVHLNISFEEPLVPTKTHYELATTPRIALKLDSTSIAASTSKTRSPEGVVVIAADGAGPEATDYAEKNHLPLLADVTTDARRSKNAINYPAEISQHFSKDINHVIVFGKPTLFRSVLELLNQPDIQVTVISEDTHWHNTWLNASEIVSLSNAPRFTAETAWLDKWHRASALPVAQLTQLDHYSAAQAIWQSDNCQRLIIGASNPIRYISTVADSNMPAHKIFSHRGLAGIDGTIATGIGVALASQEKTRIYCGDITALHDANSLLRAPHEYATDVHLVIANDNGGTIFTTLEHGKQKQQQKLVERFLTTPQRIDFKALAKAYGWEYYRIETLEDLRSNLRNYQRGNVISEIMLTDKDVNFSQLIAPQLDTLKE
ncbi:MAG: 2-succinyl-5-enolpyruvyl-6-hydroxy-3-cyclohexene-1-carboxylic-acid synthase [Micrococcaceae bacterium]